MNVENINEILVKMFKIKNTELIIKFYMIALSFSRPLSLVAYISLVIKSKLPKSEKRRVILLSSGVHSFSIIAEFLGFCRISLSPFLFLTHSLSVFNMSKSLASRSEEVISHSLSSAICFRVSISISLFLQTRF